MSGDVSSRDELIAGVRKTGHLVVADESSPRRGAAADIAALVAANAYAGLRGPVRMVTSPHAPTPFSPVLEDAYAPSAAQIASAVLDTYGTATEKEQAS